MKTIQRNGLLIDTNLLILLLVGSCHPSLIRTNKITANQGFDQNDFIRLRDFAGRFRKLVTTPHILTEVSNHTEKIKGPDRQTFIREFVGWLEIMEEQSEPARQLAGMEGFAEYGLTDSAIHHLARNGLAVITVDFRLVGFLQKRGVKAVNFNHLRHGDAGTLATLGL